MTDTFSIPRREREGRLSLLRRIPPQALYIMLFAMGLIIAAWQLIRDSIYG